MKYFFKSACTALAIFCAPLPGNAADLLPERGATSRTGNWYFTSVSEATLNQKIEELNARLVDLEVVGTSPMRFDATLVKNGGAQAGKWWWRFGLTQAQVNEITDEKKARLIDVEVYRLNGNLRYAIVMKRDTQTGWYWFVNQTPDSLKEKYRDKKMRLIDVERYRDNGQTRFAAIMVDNTGANKRRWAWFIGQTPQDISAKLDELKLRVLDLDRHGSGGNTRFDVVLSETESGQGWWYYYGIKPQEAATMALRHGARIIDVEAAGPNRVDAVLLNNGFARAGHCGGDMVHARRKIEAVMKKHAIPGAQVAVGRDGRLVMSCALGTADLEQNQKAKPDHLFRIMSVSKPITVAAIRHQVAAGKFTLGDRMLDALGDRAPSGPFADGRMQDITVDHLLGHMAGFYRDVPYDPMVSQTSVAADMGQEPPLVCSEIAAHAIKNFPLSFTPGVVPSSVDTAAEQEEFKTRKYSNLGYCILQQIVAENAAGNYQQFVKNKILKPAGITAMRIGRGRLVDRAEGEVRYYDVPFARRVSSQYANVSSDVPRPYSYVVEAMAGHGGWLASANDLVRFAQFTSGSTSHSGGLSGTSSVLVEDSRTSVAIIFNASPANEDDSYDIFALAQSIIDDTRNWPARNLWSDYGYPE